VQQMNGRDDSIFADIDPLMRTPPPTLAEVGTAGVAQ